MKNQSQSFTLEGVLVSPARNQLSARGESVRLQPKAMAVLCYLARHYDRVIDNDELIEQVWQGRVVTYGSVQKSINLMRKGLSELLGDREVVAHYSKKGYQLRIEPVYQQEQAPASQRWRLGPKLMALLALGLLVIVAGSWVLSQRHSLWLDKSHRLAFSRVQGYTSEVGHERTGTPHPHVDTLAYVRLRDSGGSQLVVRDSRARDWVVAESGGVWQRLEWSPSGRQLAVVELTDGDTGLWHPDANPAQPQLYDIHVFSLDLAAGRVLEKHRLSHWQGHIGSLAWWDENTLELVGRQGTAAVNQRFRYTLDNQWLSVLPPLEAVANPLASRIHQRMTATASHQHEGVRLDFFAPDGRRFASRQLAGGRVHFSWIPDGSGLLVYLPDTRRWLLVYRDGSMESLELPARDNGEISRPRYQATGETIYFTEQRPRANIWLAAGDDRRAVTDNTYRNYGARWSPYGEQLAYVSVRNHQPQVWLVGREGERQVSRQVLEGKVRLQWSDSGEGLLYTAGGTLYRYDPLAQTETLLWRGAQDLEPLALDSERQVLLVLRVAGESSNLWQINYGTGVTKQLTFGSVATALAYRGAVYFQYSGQAGLWRWDADSGELTLLNNALESYSRLLAVTDEGVYYVTGGECQEGSVFYRELTRGDGRVQLVRDQQRLITTDYHPDRGALYSHCRLPESDIMRWQ